MQAERCPSLVTGAPGRQLRCNVLADCRGEDKDIHHGLLWVTLPDGREHAAAVVWSTAEIPWDQAHLQRAE